MNVKLKNSIAIAFAFIVSIAILLIIAKIQNKPTDQAVQNYGIEETGDTLKSQNYQITDAKTSQ